LFFLLKGPVFPTTVACPCGQRLRKNRHAKKKRKAITNSNVRECLLYESEKQLRKAGGCHRAVTAEPRLTRARKREERKGTCSRDTARGGWHRKEKRR